VEDRHANGLRPADFGGGRADHFRGLGVAVGLAVGLALAVGLGLALEP
jgi:hypothetical protein